MKPTLVVMAAGMGSRYGGVKQIDAVGANGETLLEYGIYDALKAGFGKVVFIIRRDIEKDFRERLFDRVADKFACSYVFQDKEAFLTPEQVKAAAERTKPWGTVQCILCAEKEIPGPFAVINSDDFYGRRAYELMGKYLASASVEDCAMVGYRIKNTMSKNGTVTRGICKAEDGYLTSIVETYSIGYKEDGTITSDKGSLTGDEIASMNMFGYPRSVFEKLRQYWNDFITENASSPKAECLLPIFAQWQIENELGKYRVFDTDEHWFGMTYKEDKAAVHEELAKLTKAGVYPATLWN